MTTIPEPTFHNQATAEACAAHWGGSARCRPYPRLPAEPARMLGVPTYKWHGETVES